MSQEQAAMLYSAVPHLPKMPEPMTVDRISKVAAEPADPLTGMPQEFGQNDVREANQKVLEGYMRERFGPVYVPPLHRDHKAAVQTASSSVVAGRVVSQKDNQMSLIEPEYSFDSGGSGPRSIREMTDQSGNVVAEYGYDPYGRQIRIGGTGPDADFGYAGIYVHQRSGLNLTPYRAYSSSMGRFLNRDPIEESGGVNLYGYAANDPVNRADPSGLFYIGGPYLLPNPSGNIVRWRLNPEWSRCRIDAEFEYDDCIKNLNRIKPKCPTRRPPRGESAQPKTKEDCDKIKEEKIKDCDTKFPKWIPVDEA
jgi:RHS repeat-associated protein